MHFVVNKVPKVRSGDAGLNPIGDPYVLLKSRVNTQIDAEVNNHNGDKNYVFVDNTLT